MRKKDLNQVKIVRVNPLKQSLLLPHNQKCYLLVTLSISKINKLKINSQLN